MPNIYVTVTVDWEGETLEDRNITAMQLFRTTFPTVPITHFICPAYFSRVSSYVDILLMSRKISSVLANQIDEIALHIHCWYSFMQRAIGRYDTTPTWNRDNGPGTGVPYNPPKQEKDYGHDVPLGWYSQEEIRRAIVTGIQLLQDTPIRKTGEIESFRCGGWMAGDKVLNALRAVKFKYEASAAPGRYFRMVIAPEDDIPLDYWIPLIWSGDHKVALPTYLANSLRQVAYPEGITGLYPNEVTTPISQPANMNTLIQIPDTAALADYVSPDTLRTHIEAATRTSDTQNIFISLGWHDVNAADANFYDKNKTNIQVIADAIKLIPPGKGIFLTVRDAARRWLQLRSLQEQGLEPPTLIGKVDTQAVMPYISPTRPGIRST